jgi:hypothetical protein
MSWLLHPYWKDVPVVYGIRFPRESDHLNEGGCGCEACKSVPLCVVFRCPDCWKDICLKCIHTHAINEHGYPCGHTLSIRSSEGVVCGVVLIDKEPT